MIPIADRAVAAELGIELVGIEELFRRADVLSVSCPLTPETRHIVNAERLALMKPTAFLINTARGPIVDQKALTKALQERRIAGAGLDVLEQEPPDADDPILEARQCHTGAARAVLDRSMLCRQRRCRCARGDRCPAWPRAARRRQSRSACLGPLEEAACRSRQSVRSVGDASVPDRGASAATFVAAAPDSIARLQRRSRTARPLLPTAADQAEVNSGRSET